MHDRVIAARLIEPGELTTAQIGRVYVLHYKAQTSLERERRIGADFLAYSREHGPALVLAIADGPLLPLVPVEVRAFWRELLREIDSLTAIAAIVPGWAGIAGTALTNLLEHVVDPAFGVPLRIFLEPRPAIAWLAANAEPGLDEAWMLEQVTALRASAPPFDAPP